MNKIMMIYSIPNSNNSLRIKFTRKLYSQNVKSNGGKYTHKTKGILENYKRPTNACIVFDKGKLNDVKKLANEFLINVEFYKIQKIRP